MCPRSELEERCGKVGDARSEKREARSEKREARSNRGIKIEKLYVLDNAPEIEVGAVI